MTTEAILDKADIEQLFTENDDLYQFAWAIEQAVLRSPEIQALRKDAERYQTIRNLLYATDIPIGEAVLSMRVTGGCPDLEEFDASIDAAMEKQP